MGLRRKFCGERLAWLLPALFLLSSVLASAEPTLRWVSNPENPYRAWVEVTGLEDFVLPAKPASAAAPLEVRVESSSKTPLPAMAGNLALEKGTLRFQPSFPLEPGLRYVATFKGKPTLSASFRAPLAKPGAPPRVTRVTPSGDTLPLNLLKFYLHFSAPMTRGDAYRHIQLRDTAGKRIADPFLELPEELWNPEMTRLTVLLDPGRIKRGLLPNEVVGAVLESGKDYQLAITPTWKGASGQLLEKAFTKTFRATAPDYVQPDPRKWRLVPPSPGTRAPLRITFAESLDAALAARLISVSRNDRLLAGTVALHQNETVWEFRPDQSWRAGLHQLLVDHRLEDRVGNSIERPFEEALDRHPEEAGKPPARSRIAFTVDPSE